MTGTCIFKILHESNIKLIFIEQRFFILSTQMLHKIRELQGIIGIPKYFKKFIAQFYPKVQPNICNLIYQCCQSLKIMCIKMTRTCIFKILHESNIKLIFIQQRFFILSTQMLHNFRELQGIIGIPKYLKKFIAYFYPTTHLFEWTNLM